jgi:hypothetical protein
VELPEQLVNRFVKIDGTYQLPITLVRRAPFIGFRGMTALDVNRMTWPELRSALEQIAEHELPVATFFMHYRSLYARTVTGEDQEIITVTGPDEDDIRSFEHVLQTVTKDRRFRVVTASELWKVFTRTPRELEGPSFIPYTGIWLTYLKAWRDIRGHGLTNKIVALAPIAVILVVFVGWRMKLRNRPKK